MFETLHVLVRDGIESLVTQRRNKMHAQAGRKRLRHTVLRLERSLPNTPVVHANLDEASTEPNNRLVYEKGAWTLHMLRDVIGTIPPGHASSQLLCREGCSIR